MPGDTVVVKRVKRREVKATTEPPVAHRLAIARDKEADIGVAGWHIGIARVDDERQAEGAKGAAGKMRPFFRGNCWQLLAVHGGHIHPALLNHRAIF